MNTFAVVYKNLFNLLINTPYLEFECRGLKMWKEMSPVHVYINMSLQGVSVFSCPSHRVVPIKFILAELCYILAERDDVESIASYNKGMEKYSEDGGKTISGAYGFRLKDQLKSMIARLIKDEYTRQACGVIYQESDALSEITHMPCNVFLQFLCRHPYLDLHVFSRSSDFVTGFSIDAIHWQFLLLLMKNELRERGKMVLAHQLHYTVSSLHIYDSDREHIQKWSIEPGTQYEYLLKTSMTLSQAIDECKKHFKAGMLVEDLCNLIGIPYESCEIVFDLVDLYKTHRNAIKR